jgi:dipeptidyl aminopeptidase/acylaminoacyl peptidase
MKIHAARIMRTLVILSFLGCRLYGNIKARCIPLEDFFKESVKSFFQLSPDGKRYAYLAPFKGQETLFIVDISRNKTSDLSAAVAGAIEKYLWIDFQTILYQQTNANGETQVFTVELATKKARRIKNAENNEFKLADKMISTGDKILIYAKNGPRAAWKIRRLENKTGRIITVYENLENIAERIADHEGQYRLATQEERAKTCVLFRDSEVKPFRRLFDFDNVRDIFRPQFFTPDNKNFYAYSNLNRDKVALVEYDPHANAEVKVIYEDPEYDLFGDDETDFIKYSEQRNKLAYIFYTTWRRAYHFLDVCYEKMIYWLQQKFPGYEIRIISSDRNEEKHIIKLSSERLRGKYYLFDGSDHSLVFIEDTYPWLVEEELAVKKPIRFQARDGFSIHGYLTLPKNIVPKSLPLVVYAHGGPQWRDCWEMGRFTEIQFLANRGYAVLNVNFRGSAGYGKKFMTAGFKQNGLNVQQDIADGVNYLAGQNIVSKGRVAIIGGSYGGYAVLAGLAFTPETYACGVDLFGVSNFFTFFNSLPPWFNKESLSQTIGHPEHDRALLERTSPFFHADKINVPLLVAQGGKDPIVNRAESDQMVDALRKRGIPVEYILKENEGHGYFRDEQNRLELWQAIERFLAKYIGGNSNHP